MSLLLTSQSCITKINSQLQSSVGSHKCLSDETLGLAIDRYKNMGEGFFVCKNMHILQGIRGGFIYQIKANVNKISLLEHLSSI